MNRGVFYIVLASACFGLSNSVGPLTYSQGSNVFTLLLLNNLLALPVLALAMALGGIGFRCRRQTLPTLLGLGLVGCAGTSLTLNLSFLLVGVGMGSMLHMAYTVIVAVADSILLRQRLRGETTAALVCILLGAASMASGGSADSSRSLGGVCVALLSGCAYAFYLLGLAHSAVREEHPLRVLFYTLTVSTIPFLLYALFTHQLAVSTMTPLAWAFNLLCALCTNVFGFLLMQLGIRRVGASEAAILSALEPITGLALGQLLLGEALTTGKLAGSLCILAGVCFPPVVELWKRRFHLRQSKRLL